MSTVLQEALKALENSLLMAWQVWWALVLGFAVSAIVQAWVPRARVQDALGGRGPRPLALATILGAASSSCSYAAVAIGRSLLAKGASAASALAFEFSSTNLVVELGVVLWLLIGWQFALAEYLGGVLLVCCVAVFVRAFVPAGLEARARDRARDADGGHEHVSSESAGALSSRLGSLDAWSDVARNFRNDWAMVWREVAIGFLLAGCAGLLGNGFYRGLFAAGAPGAPRLLENVLVGPLIAVASFVCSVGNVPLAAVLWSGGISFAGVISFVFADLLILPILQIRRRYYGSSFAIREAALTLVAIVLCALAVDGALSTAGLVPSARPARSHLFGSVRVDHTLFLDAAATLAFAALMALTWRRGALDPVCGMSVDRARAITERTGGRTLHFCSEHCRDRFRAQGPV